MTRSLYEPSLWRATAKNGFGVKSLKQKPLAMRWWQPDCTPGTGGCTGDEPALQNGWAQPAAPLQKFAFRTHADGSLEFRGHLDSVGASSGTVAVTLPGANPGETDFLLPNDQFFVSAVYDGATPRPALIYLDSTTGDVTITFPL
jgi:hypothetical protein